MQKTVENVLLFVFLLLCLYVCWPLLGLSGTWSSASSFPIVSAQRSTYATALPKGVSFATPYVQEAWDDASTVGIPEGYYVRQIYQESGFNPQARGQDGEIGIAQLLPSTASALGIQPADPHDALRGAASYMASLSQQYGGDYKAALAAYNAGSGCVDAAISREGANWRNAIPATTNHYITVITGE
jgi:soluble lytic murein transglycosylase-like protein